MFSKKLTPRVEPGTILILSGIITGFLYWRFSHWYYDDPFITFRYSLNLISGNGLVYNPGERILSTTTPFFAVFLAFLGLLNPNIPRLADLAGILCLVLSGIIFWRLGQQWRMPWVGRVGFLLIPIFPLAVGTLGSEMPLYIALALGAIWAYSRRAYGWTALLCSVLEFVRPDGILLPVILALHFLWRVRGKIPWKAVLLFGLVSAAGWGLLWLYFGSPIPVTLAAKQGQGGMNISMRFAPGFLYSLRTYAQKWYYWVDLALAGLGLAWLIYKRSSGLILIVWNGLYFLAYTVLGVSRYTWYYAPLVPGFILLVGAGLQALFSLVGRFKDRLTLPLRYWQAGLVGALLVLFAFEGWNLYQMSFYPDRRYDIYQAAGQWLAVNTPSGSKVGTLEVGIMGYYAHRTIVDFAGLIEPAVSHQMKSETTYLDTALWAIQQYHPDYLVLQAGVFAQIENGYAHDHCQVVTRFAASQYQTAWDLLVYQCSR